MSQDYQSHNRRNTVAPVLSPPLPHWKSGLSIGMAAIEGDNLEVFYYISESEMWPSKRGAL